MKVRVKTVFFDDKGLHKVGDVIDTETFDERRMEKVVEKVAEKKAIKKSNK